MKRYESKDIDDGLKIKCKGCGRQKPRKLAQDDGWIIKTANAFCPGCPEE